MTEPDLWIQELLKINDDKAGEKMTEKQLRIIQAAAEIFAEKGFAATSTSEIAKRAGVAEGTIFRHYKTKKELLLSLVIPVLTKLIAPVFMRDFIKVVEVPYTRFEDFLYAICQDRVEFARKNMPLIKIMLQEVPFHTELREQFMETVAQQTLARLQTIIEHYQQQGQIIKLPPLTVVRLTASSIIGFILVRFLLAPQQPWQEQEEIEHTVQFIIRGLTPGS